MLSIIIPTHNEEENIEELLEGITGSLQGRDYEIIMIDDASTDRTRDEIRKAIHGNDNIFLYPRSKKQGLGSAYKYGIILSKGNRILTIDADLSHDPKDIPRFIRTSEQGYDIVIGSRSVSGGKRKDSLHRRIFPRIGSLLYRIILRSDIKDITSGYRLYSKNSLERIDLEALPDDFSFQAAILFALEESGAKATEIPIFFKRRQRGIPKYTTCDLKSNIWLLARLAHKRYKKYFSVKNLHDIQKNH